MSEDSKLDRAETYRLSVAVYALEEEARLEARELAAQRRAAKIAGNGPGWVTQRAVPGKKAKPDIWGVKQPDGLYKSLGRSGKWHLVFGASGSAKTFMVAGLVAQSLIAREPVYWADFEDQGDDLPDMLRAFHVHDLTNLHLFQPEAPPDAAELVAYCEEHHIRTVVMDAQRGALSNAVPGEFGNSGHDVELFSSGLIRPLTKAGITVITIDHVAKAAGGGMPIGTERKFSAADIVFELSSVLDIYEDAKLGYSALTVRKYRGGAYRKGVIPAHLVVRNGKAAIEAESPVDRLEQFATVQQNGTVNRDLERRAVVVEYVGRHQDEVPSQAQIAGGLMAGRPDLFTSEATARRAIKFATDTKYIEEKSGGGRVKVYELPAERVTVDPSQLQPVS